MTTSTALKLPVVQVEIVNGKPAVTSLQVAEVFGKEHKHVLRDIEGILPQVSEIFGKTNFGLTEYETNNNLGFTVRKPLYLLTKDGFSMLAMGYNGQKAFALKEHILAKLNAYESGQRPLATLPTDFATALRALADSVEQKALVEAKLALAEPKAEVYDTVVADKILTLYHFARKLTGANCQNIKARLVELGYFYKTTNLPYKVRSEFRGVLFDEKLVGGKADIVVLDKGKKELTRLYREGKLNMRRGHAA